MKCFHFFFSEKRGEEETSWHNVIKETHPVLLFVNIIDILIEILHICAVPDKETEHGFRVIREIIHEN